MGKDKMTTCKSCGHEISAKGKVTCPSCGRVNKKPFYKRTWFIVLAVIVVLGAIGSGGSDDGTSTSSSSSNDKPAVEKEAKQETVEEVKEPIIITVDELVDALDDNALKASKTYKGQYVELTGELVSIDSAGDYFSIGILDDEFSLDTVLCRIKDEHLDKVMEFTDGQEVTILGTITDVGEVLGYTVKVESIK